MRNPLAMASAILGERGRGDRPQHPYATEEERSSTEC